MTKQGLAAIAAIAAAALAWGLLKRPADEAAGPESGGPGMVAVTLPATLSDKAARGAAVFAARCASCHGDKADGREGAGPPLIHKIYEPSHHGDMSFFLAVENGVRSHHWRFGNMAPVDGVTRAEIGAMIAYVREVQRANGIN